MDESRDLRAWLGWALAGIATVLSILGFVAALNDAFSWEELATSGLVLSCTLGATMAILGAFVVSRSPAHRLGWVFLAMGTTRAINAAAIVWAHHTLVVDPGSLPFAGLASWLGLVLRFPAIVLAGLALLWFPNGRAPSLRWRKVEWLAAANAVLLLVSGALVWSYRGPTLLPDAPIPNEPRAQAADALTGLFLLLGVVAILAAMVSLVVRWRAATGQERLQLKWFFFGAAATLILDVLGNFALVLIPLQLVAPVVLEVAIGIAIFRYRLWAIDRLISRTLVYGILTLGALSIYTAAVLATGVLVGTARASLVAAAGASLVVALLLQPTRRWLQDLVDRRFDRRTWDAVARVRSFTGQLDQQGDQPGAVRDVLADALLDQSLDVRFHVRGEDRLVDGWGRDLPLQDDGAQTRVAVKDLSIATIAHRLVAPEDRRVFDRVVAESVIALQYARLEAEVRLQLSEVEASRARIATAADRERRRVERDLHDGAQQRLVALGLRLRTEQRQLERGKDPPVDVVLNDAVDEIRQAVEELRELAQGVLPGLLATGGLASAIPELVRRHPTSVEVLALPDVRLPETAELTAWFVISEALANASKHSPTSEVELAVRIHDGKVHVCVSDRGEGGAALAKGTGLRGLQDRVDALGGHLSITSEPGRGTTITAEFPCAS